ncbi:MAG: MATE family efflux transporter [Bacteroidetes bacterium]|nr:MATE family efflux transporter [Bacteroidota bacterium]
MLNGIVDLRPSMSKNHSSRLQLKMTNRQIFQMAMPIAASILVPQANFITNNIFLGALGEQPLAVAGITGVYYLFFAVIGFGLSNGLQVLISRRSGENHISAIGILYNQGILLAIVLAVFSIVFTIFLSPGILSASLHHPDNISMAIGFLKIRIWGILFLYLYQMSNALLVGTNQSKYLLYGTILETIINILLDYCLINGKWGMPPMGFNGAAVASVLSEFTALLTVLCVIHFKKIAQRFALFRQIYLNKIQLSLILNQSLPLIMQYALSIGSWEFFYIIIEHHGERDLAISNIIRNLFGLFGCITWAFAATTNTMVSNFIGQGLQDKVVPLIIKIMKWSVLFSTIIFVLLNCWPGILMPLYGQDEAFTQAAIPVVRVVSVALILMSISTIWLNAVIGTGNTKINLAIEMLAISFYCIFVYTVLEKLNLPITVGWCSEWVYWTTLFIPSFLYIKSNRWRKKIL